MKRSGAVRLRYPGAKRFAFTMFDDCDNSTVANTRPVYDLLERLQMRTTKTVWSFDSGDTDVNWLGASTLEDPEYRAFCLELQARGFEIASHGASMMSSARERTQRGLEFFLETFGHYPRSYANHGANRENVYWSDARFRSRLLRILYAWSVTRNTHSEGHVAKSPYFWGDLCRQHIEYVRGFTFPVLNLFSLHQNVVYADPATPFVNFWFSASHAPDVTTFNELISRARVERLVREGGVSIVATHLAAGFVWDGQVNRETRRLLESLAEQDGWFVPVSTLLDYLRREGLGRRIPERERRVLEVRWVFRAIRRGRGS